VLAREVTTLVHGAEEARKAEEAARALFEHKAVDPSQLPTTELPAATPLVDALVSSGLCKSKSDARRAIEQGGVYVDEQRVTDVPHVLAAGGHVIQRGKRDKHFVKVG